MRIHPLDLVIVIAYLLGVTALGIRFRRGQHNATDYFLGGRTSPWWALAFSIVATETSTLTIIGHHRHHSHRDLYLRRRHESRNLDRCGAVVALSLRKCRNLFRAPSPHSRRLERSDASGRRRWPQITDPRFFLESRHQIHVLV